MSETPWSVRAGDKCTRIGCDKRVVAACLPHHFGGCEEHMREHDTRCSHVPAAAPAADEVSDLLGRGHVENPREGEPGDAETYSSPAPLLPRVLAALEDVDGGMNMGCASLAAELRAYIAERDGETDLLGLLNEARHELAVFVHEPRKPDELLARIDRLLAARAATAKGEGT